MPRGLIAGIILTTGGVTVFIFTVFLYINIESWNPVQGVEWVPLTGLIGGPALIFVGIKILYFHYLERKLLRKL